MPELNEYKSDVANVQLGDVSKVAKFDVVSMASDGQTTLTATAKPPKGKKFAVLLLGVIDKDDNPLDYDLDAALARLGYVNNDDNEAEEPAE